MSTCRICPECNIELEEKTKYFNCPICGYSEKKYEWYRELLKEEYWCKKALTEYPSLIREKYLSIKTNLEEGQIPAAWLMLRDLFEITLKLPLILLICKDIKEDNIPYDTIVMLTERPISLGTWEEIGNNYCKKIKTKDEISNILKDILYTYKKGKITSWRNDNIGHGAFSVKELESTYKEDIKNLLIYITKHYETNLTNYKEMNLAIMDEKVYWAKGEINIELSPFINLIENGIYFFDAYYSNTNKTGLLDYLSADKRKKMLSKMKDLHLLARTYSEITSMDYSVERDMFSSRYIDVLENIERNTKIYDLTFLKDELNNLLSKNSKGIFLLEMEAGMGKTTFIRSIDPLYSKRNKLNSEIETRAFYINNTYAHTPNFFALELLDLLRRERDNTKVMANNLYYINPYDENVKINVANLLRKFSDYYNKKLLFIIDGLDETPVSSGITIFDMIPDKDMLPDNVFILLTSRPSEFTTKFITNKINNIKKTRTIKVTTNTKDYKSTVYSFTQNTFKVEEDKISKIVSIADNRFLNLDLLKRIYSHMSLEELYNKNIINTYLDILNKYYTEVYFEELAKILVTLGVSPQPLTISELSTLIGYDSINFKILYYLAELRGLWQRENSYKNNLLSLQRVEYKEEIIKRFPKILSSLCKDWEDEIRDFRFEDINYEKINLATILLNIIYKFHSINNKEITESSGFKMIEKWISEELENYYVEQKHEEYQIVELLDIMEKFLLDTNNNYTLRRLSILTSKLKYIMDSERGEYYFSARITSEIIKDIIINNEFYNYNEAVVCIKACSYVKRVQAMINDEDIETKINNQLNEKQNYLFNKYKELKKSKIWSECKLLDYVTEAKVERGNSDYEFCIVIAKEGIDFYRSNAITYPETFKYYAQLLNYVASSYRHLFAENHGETKNRKFTYIQRCGEYYYRLQEEIENFISIYDGKEGFNNLIRNVKKRLINVKMEISMYYSLKGEAEKALDLIQELLIVNESLVNMGLVLDDIVRVKAIHNRGLIYFNNLDYKKALEDAMYVEKEIQEKAKKTGIIDTKLFSENNLLIEGIRRMEC